MLAAVVFPAGLITAAIAVLVGPQILRGRGISVIPVSGLTDVRVIVGAAGLLALGSVFAFALGALLRRTWAAILAALSTMVVAYLLGVIPFLPQDVSEWLLRLSPAAGFAVLQTAHEYPQVTAHYAPYAGYYPLPWWAGFAVLCGYAVLALWLAARRLPRGEQPVDWR
jgi:hypothetical protein